MKRRNKNPNQEIDHAKKAQKEITELTYIPSARAAKNSKGQRVYKPILIEACPTPSGMIKKFSTVLGRSGIYSMSQGTTFKDREQAIAYANESIKSLMKDRQVILDKEQKRHEKLETREGVSEELLKKSLRILKSHQYVVDRYKSAIIEDLIYDPSQAIREGLERELEEALNSK